MVVSTLWVLTMTRVHRDSITQSSFTALKILHSTVHLSFPTDPGGRGLTLHSPDSEQTSKPAAAFTPVLSWAS